MERSLGHLRHKRLLLSCILLAVVSFWLTKPKGDGDFHSGERFTNAGDQIAVLFDGVHRYSAPLSVKDHATDLTSYCYNFVRLACPFARNLNQVPVPVAKVLLGSIDINAP